MSSNVFAVYFYEYFNWCNEVILKNACKLIKKYKNDNTSFLLLASSNSVL